MKSLPALLITLKLSSAQMLMNAFVAEIALVLDQFEAKVVLNQHIRGVLNLEADVWADGPLFPACQTECHALVPETLRLARFTG